MLHRAVLVLGLLLAACQAAPADSIYDFVMANSDYLQLTLELIDKADQRDFYSDPEANGTFFICPDQIILIESTLAASLAATSHLMTNFTLNASSVAKAVSGVRAGTVETAKRFLEDSTIGRTYSTATSLVKAGRLKTLSGVTLVAQPDNVSGVCITGGTGTPTGGCRVVKGPVAIPIGNAVIYLMDSCLSDLTVFVRGALTR